MKQPTKTPYDQMPDKVRLLVAMRTHLKTGMVLENHTSQGNNFYFNKELDYCLDLESVDALLQAGWAEPVVQKTRLARVEKGERYWSVDARGVVCEMIEDGLYIDDKMYELGNYVHTEAQAQRIIDSGELQAVFAKWQKIFAEEARG